jgi:hypothetical protein
MNIYSKWACGASIQMFGGEGFMTSNLRLSIAAVVLAISLLPVGLPAQSTPAQSVKQAPPAPVPGRILAAKRAFIANAGEDERSTTGPLYDGGPDRAYNGFYAGLKSWGHYELVNDPADADLVLEIQFSVERPVLKGDTLTSSDFDPKFRLTIRDPRSSVLLWGFTEHAQWALLQGNRDKNFDLALAKIVGDVQALGAEVAGSAKGVKQ